MKILLIYNTASGKGHILRDLDKIQSYIEHNGWNLDLYEVKEKKEIVSDIQSKEGKYDVFLIAGGDGTIHSVVNGMMKMDRNKRPRLLFLPYGTTNDVASMISLGKNVFYNLALLKTNHIENMDIYKINEEYFLYAAAIGKFSNVSYEINRKRLKEVGSFGYLMNARHDLWNHYHMKIKVTSKDLTIERKSFLMILAAGSRVGGFKLDKFTKSPKLNDGMIDLRIFTRNHMFSWTKMIWFYLFKGRHFHNDIHLHANAFKIEVTPDYPWNVDGEKGPLGSVNVSVHRQELDVYVNPKSQHKLF